MAGRGTDIMLGGNPEFIADVELRQRGLDPVDTPEEYEAAWPDALEKAQQAVAAEHEEVTGLGGLYVLGTERHESRRIDNQLRGRSGRQGDPGESRFYLSLGDDLMRLFKSAVVEQVLTRFNVPEDVPIESKMVTRAIASAQSQVEQQNFQIRKDVLKYDEVLNRQRLVIYEERRRVLHGEDLHEQVRHFVDDTVDSYVAAETSVGFPEEWDLEKLWTAFKQVYPITLTIEDVEEASGGGRGGLSAEFIAEQVKEDAQAAYDRREAQLGDEVMRELERRVVLQVLDRKWREHLYEMDYLREGIGLRAMAQRDPLVEYQREGYDLFAVMMDAIKEESVGYLFNLEVQVEQPEAEQEAAEPEPATAAAAASAGRGQHEPQHPQIVAKGLAAPARPARMEYIAPTVDGAGGVEHRPARAISDAEHPEWGDVPRNAPCPCGSGKKFKRCHGDPRNRVNA